MKLVILLSLFFSTNSWACPDKTKSFWIEPEGTIKVEGCLSAEPYAVTFYKLGEIVYSKAIKKDGDLKLIELDLAKNSKLKKYSDIQTKLEKAYLAEIEVQNQIIKNQLSLLNLVNQNLNLSFYHNPCPETATTIRTSKVFTYQDLSCIMENPQEKLDISKDLIVSLRSDFLYSDKALLSDKKSRYVIEIKNKKGEIINTGHCHSYNTTQIATIPDKKENEILPSFLSSGQSTISLDLDGKTKMPLDYTIKESDSKDDKKSLDLGLSMGLSRDFQVPSGQSMNISTGVEMPILHGVESAQDVFNRDRFSLDPNQVTIKFQVHLKF